MERLWRYLKESLMSFMTLVTVYVIAINLFPVSHDTRYIVYTVALIIYLVGRSTFVGRNKKLEQGY